MEAEFNCSESINSFACIVEDPNNNDEMAKAVPTLVRLLSFQDYYVRKNALLILFELVVNERCLYAMKSTDIITVLRSYQVASYNAILRNVIINLLDRLSS